MKKYAVIGNPIKHSLSPQLHTAFAEQFDIALDCTRIFSSLDDFESTLRLFQKSGGLGMNVTSPFKQLAFSLCDKVSDYAKRAGAVNTLIFKKNGSVIGHNTDGIGLVRDLPTKVTDKTLLILGAGGAVRGVLPALLNENPASITIANRTLEKALALEKEFKVTGCDIKEYPHTQFDFIINGTSASHAVDLPYFLFHENTIAYDMNYTQTVRWPKKITTYHGFGMLVEQAAQSFFLMHEVMPDTKDARVLSHAPDFSDNPLNNGF